VFKEVTEDILKERRINFAKIDRRALPLLISNQSPVRTQLENMSVDIRGVNLFNGDRLCPASRGALKIMS
jgi:hypothetical protein